MSLLILIDQLIGYCLDKKYESNTCFFSNGEVNDYIQNKKCDTLFVGSSRVLHMVDPSVFGPNCYNLAKQRKHIYYTTSILDILNDSKKLPSKLLVLNIEVADLFMEKEPLLIEQVNSLSFYYSKNTFVTKFINKQGWQERLKFMSEIYRHNPNGLMLITNKMENVCSNYPDKGYLPLMPSIVDSARLAQSLIDDFKPIRNQEINQVVLENIRHINGICSKKGIDLVIIDAPYYKVHPAHKKASTALNLFCKRNGIRFIDFNFEHIPGLKDKTNWYDNLHTNEKGTMIYTHYLKEKL